MSRAVTAAGALTLALSLATSSASAVTPIVAWGDSLTLGAKASSASKAYPAQLAAMLGRAVTNKGIGSQTSREIAARQGGVPALLTFQGNLLLPSGTSTTSKVSALPVTENGPGSLKATVQGVHGTVTLAKSQYPSLIPSQLNFRRDGAGSALMIAAGTPLRPDTNGMESWVNVFWMGHNNNVEPARVVADVAGCVSSLASNRYVVLSVLNRATEGLGTDGYGRIAVLNSQLSQMFPNNYLDVRSMLVAAYKPSDAQDVADHLADRVPSSLRGDAIHLNDEGYRLVAARVAEFIRQRAW